MTLPQPFPAAPRAVALFSGTPGLWETIAPHTLSKRYANGSIVIHHGDPANALWLVNSGWIKLVRQTPDGKETIIGLCTEGDIFGEAALFPNANYPYYAEIVGTDAELISIPSLTIRQTIQSDSKLSSRIMSMMNERVAQAQLKLEHIHTLSAAQRLGCFLLRLCHTDHGNKKLHIPVEKHILAAYLGMKAETFSRSLQQLKPLGIQVNGPTVAIENVERLRDFVCNSCSESGMCDIEDSVSE